MKIVAVEMLYPKGHKSLNKTLVKIMAKFADVLVMDYKNYYDGLNETEKIKKFTLKRQFFARKGAPLIRLCFIINLLLIKLKLRKVDYDAIVLFSINNITYSYARFLFRKKQVFVFHHNDIDMLSKSREKKIFKKYMNTVDHLVFADFIREGLIVQTGIDGDKVHVVNHPITEPIPENKMNNSETNGKKTFVGLGLSNDEKLINELIELDKLDLFNSPNSRVVLRSRNKKYRGNMIDVISEYLDNKDYMKMYQDATACLLCYPDTFKLRYSGSFINAMIHQKMIITTDILLGQHFNRKYPHNCIVVNNAKDLLQNIVNFNNTFDGSEYDKFLKEHSEDNISDTMRDIIRRRLDESK
jgi:hypothetical protein